MRNAICRWAAAIGCSMLAVAMLGCAPSGSDRAATAPAGSPAAPHEHGDQADHEDGQHGHADHEHADRKHAGHDHEGSGSDAQLPADFAAAVTVLRQQHAAIRDALQAGDKAQADGPLHRVGHLLEAVPELAGKAKLSEPDLAAAKSAATVMFEAYGEIDQRIHDGKEPDYGAVSGKLDKALAELNELAKRLADAK